MKSVETLRKEINEFTESQLRELEFLSERLLDLKKKKSITFDTFRDISNLASSIEVLREVVIIRLFNLVKAGHIID